jgi:hypothetical protein
MRNLAEDAAAEEVLKRISQLREDSPRRWGKMTVSGMVCHLTDCYELALGQRPAKSVRTPIPGSVIKFISLYSTMPWPKGVPTRPEFEQGKGGTPPVDFERDRRRLKDTIGRFRDSQATLHKVPHPIFGAMSAGDWMRWGYLHASHHLRQFGV